MDWKLSYKKIINSDNFKQFLDENKDAKLVSIVNKVGKEEWQFNFLSQGKLFVFESHPEVKLVTETIPANENVEEVDVEKIEVSPHRALDKAMEIFNENFKGNITSKLILIHKGEDGKEEYSITFITSGFEMVNIRLDAQTNEVKNVKSNKFI